MTAKTMDRLLMGLIWTLTGALIVGSAAAMWSAGCYSTPECRAEMVFRENLAREERINRFEARMAELEQAL